MKKYTNWILGFVTAFMVGTAIAGFIQRPSNPSTGLSAGLSYFPDNSVPTGVNGEVAVRVATASGGEHELVVYQGSNGTWKDAAQIVLVKHEGFDLVTPYQTLLAAGVYGGVPLNADATTNVITLPGSQIGQIEYKLKGATTDFATVGAMVSQQFTPIIDVTAAEGVDMIFGGWAAGTNGVTGVSGTGGGGAYDETGGLCSYVETRLTIALPLSTSDMAFGWRLNEALSAAPAASVYNTYAVFTLTDPGVLSISTRLNAGGAITNATAVSSWVAGDAHVLRVTACADTVNFTLDGVLVTQTTAVLNFDDGDIGVPFFYYLNDVTATAFGPKFDYVDIGRAVQP